MSKKIERLSAVKREVAEEVGGLSITFALEDDSEFTIPHPMFQDKETKKALGDLEDGNDLDAIARILLGDQYDEFIAHGGEPDDLTYVNLKYARHGKAYLEGRPTR